MQGSSSSSGGGSSTRAGCLRSFLWVIGDCGGQRCASSGAGRARTLTRTAQDKGSRARAGEGGGVCGERLYTKETPPLKAGMIFCGQAGEAARLELLHPATCRRWAPTACVGWGGGARNTNTIHPITLIILLAPQIMASGSSPPLASLLLRSPIEEVQYLARRRQKRTERDLSDALAPLTALHADRVSRDDARAAVDSALQSLRALKRRVASSLEEEEEHLRNTRSRVIDASSVVRGDSGGISGGGPEGEPAGVVEQLIVDYLVRNELDAIATTYAKEAAVATAIGGGKVVATPTAARATPPGESIVSAPQAELRRLLDAVRRDDDVAPALEWASVHKAKLKKLKTPLEALLRVHAFAALARRGATLDAVRYARDHFPALEPDHPALVREAMGALARLATARAGGGEGGCGGGAPPLLSDARQQELLHHLRAAHGEVTGAPSRPPLTTALTAALSVLRTPHCRPADDHRRSANSGATPPPPPPRRRRRHAARPRRSRRRRSPHRRRATGRQDRMPPRRHTRRRPPRRLRRRSPRRRSARLSQPSTAGSGGTRHGRRGRRRAAGERAGAARPRRRRGRGGRLPASAPTAPSAPGRSRRWRRASPPCSACTRRSCAASRAPI